MARHTSFGWVGLAAALVLTSGPLAAQGAYPGGSGSIEIANLREDLRVLTQRVGDLGLRVDQLERQNSDLQAKAGQNFVTLTQLNASLADLSKSMQAAIADDKRDTLHEVSLKLEKLARETQAAIDAVAKGAATRAPVAPPTFTENYSKEGVSYTVQRGDTLSNIAHKTGGKVEDIINANKITDPSRLQVGQTLFIPGGK
ncbi:MAG TPA: LysM peptidoglycan-binding domain-containing protein [Opitutaceae bacterium]|nr:LysM peptidoglycan-binding domain-containing protein [Opitutaceae bacterium]